MLNLSISEELLSMISKNNETKEFKLPQIKKVNFSHWNFDGPQLDDEMNQVAIKHQAELLTQGVIIQDLNQALKDPANLVHKIQGQVIKEKENDLIAEDYQHCDCGLFIYIPQNLSLSSPLEIDVRQTTALNYHLVMLVDNGSSAEMIETFKSRNSKLTGGKIIEEILVAQNATLHLNTIQNIKNATTYFKQRIVVQQDSQVIWNVGAFNLKNNINENDICLSGTGSQGTLKVVSLANQKQVQGFNSRIANKAPYTTARMTQRAIVLDRAQIVLNGIGEIDKGAHGADLQQENRLLMLSQQARGDANPVLLIDENDVQAAHAASVGKIDAQKMYYLMSRGLTFKKAQQLLIRSFLSPVILQVPNQQLRVVLQNQIEKRIQDEL